MPATQKKTDVMDSKSLRLVKKSRKQMRKLRKRSVRAKNTTAMTHAEKLIEILDTIIADQKLARAAAKMVEHKK